MTDPPPLSPEQDAVRRLLAAARHHGSAPPEVVTRLDETLAALVAERGERPLPGEGHAPPPVIDLGARRRRRAGIGLLAAAAVVVAGVAIGQVLPRLSGGDDAGSSSAGNDMATSETRDREDAGGSDAGSGGAEMGPESLKSTPPAPEAGLPVLSSVDAALADDLLRLRDEPRSTTGPGWTLGGCDLRGIGEGRRLPAQVDGFAGAVVFRRPEGAAQQVDLYLCGSPEPVRTLSLPAP